MKLFPSHGQKKECTLETANVTGTLDSDVGLLVCKRTEVRFPQVRFSSYLLGRSHGYLKACIFVAGIKLEIWWATFQEIKATNKVAFIPFSTLRETTNGWALLWLAGRAANNRDSSPHKSSTFSGYFTNLSVGHYLTRRKSRAGEHGRREHLRVKVLPLLALVGNLPFV